jgi:hypothetical protein
MGSHVRRLRAAQGAVSRSAMRLARASEAPQRLSVPELLIPCYCQWNLIRICHPGSQVATDLDPPSPIWQRRAQTLTRRAESFKIVTTNRNQLSIELTRETAQWLIPQRPAKDRSAPKSCG